MPTKRKAGKKPAAKKRKKPIKGKGIKTTYRRHKKKIDTALGVLGGLTALGFAMSGYENYRANQPNYVDYDPDYARVMLGR